MTIKLLPLYSGFWREPSQTKASVRIEHGRLQVALGFWRYSFKPVKTFFWRKWIDDRWERHLQLRVWRLMVGFRWEKKQPTKPCRHEELDMDGVCKSCGQGGAPSRW